MSGLAFNAFYGALYPVYVRGEAYLAARQGVEAAAEFQKILDHPGIVLADPIGTLAHLQLGRALAMSGDHAKARTAYQAFLTRWKAAERDPDPQASASGTREVEVIRLDWPASRSSKVSEKSAVASEWPAMSEACDSR